MDDDSLALIGLDWNLECEMQHFGKDCDRIAQWLVRIHHCRLRDGIEVMCCDDFIERMKKASYPYRCPYCQHCVTSILDAVWHIRPLNNKKATP